MTMTSQQIQGNESSTVSIDKFNLVNKVLKFYRDGWQDYDHTTLIEQTKELEFPPKNAKTLSREELVECLIQEDKKNLEKMSVRELLDELSAQKKC
jgi:hypothetical protein